MLKTISRTARLFRYVADLAFFRPPRPPPTTIDELGRPVVQLTMLAVRNLGEATAVDVMQLVKHVSTDPAVRSAGVWCSLEMLERKGYLETRRGSPEPGRPEGSKIFRQSAKGAALKP
jgi:hypothetical protein